MFPPMDGEGEEAMEFKVLPGYLPEGTCTTTGTAAHDESDSTASTHKTGDNNNNSEADDTDVNDEVRGFHDT